MDRRIKSGIERLDSILRGGIPQGSMILLAGGPGTGKTIFSARFLYSGMVDYNEPCMYVSFTEGREDFRRYMLKLGWDFAELEQKGLFTLLDFFSTGEEGLDYVIKSIVDAVPSKGIKRLVVDSVTALSISLNERYKVRNIIYLLKRFLKPSGCTTMLIVEVPFGYTLVSMGVEEFVADGIILLEMQREGYEFKRRMAVLKMRGTEHETKYFRFDIEPEVGIRVLPILAE